MGRKFILVFLSLTHLLCYSQCGTWTWVKGDTIGQGHMGTKGVTDPADYPYGRYQAAYWTDLDGNFWIFGGSLGIGAEMGDLWKYDPGANTWTWMSGQTQQRAGIYGTQGIPGPNNTPGARGWGAQAWADLQGHLWLGGGLGYDGYGVFGYLDDMWMYDILSNEWTWMKGSESANTSTEYGTLQTEDPGNTPGSFLRQELTTTWVKSDGTLWTYDGDMWKYDVGTNNWTWMGGDQGQWNNCSYGTKGVASPSNLPPGRSSYTKWQDEDDNFYIFAGWRSQEYQADSVCNDLWAYNSNTYLWTWIGGSATMEDPGAYPQACTPGSQSLPASRYENRTVQKPGCSNFLWTFGGFMGTPPWTGYNDLWVYNTQTNEWLWMSGSSAPGAAGSHGTINVSSPSNMPSGRGGSSMWMDQAGVIWLWSGDGNLSDMWKFEPDPNLIDTSCIKVLPDSFAMPSAFSPNGDGKNDLFSPVFMNDAYAISFKIYNRWGQLIYDDPSAGWDGKYKGEDQPADVYFYFVLAEISDTKHPGAHKEMAKEGTFELMR